MIVCKCVLGLFCLCSFTGYFNNIVGSDEYDIGHVLDYDNKIEIDGDGIALFESLCDNTYKGGGWSALKYPDVQFHVIDYIAHEIGHQFGCNHIHQNCNVSFPANVEPGSGSTIMGYAGICAPNIQNNSDPYFNRYNIWEHVEYVSTISCGNILSEDKKTPIIAANYTDVAYQIPAGSYFELYTPVTNIDDAVTVEYAWEGVNTGNAAIWRSYNLTTPYRRFPLHVGAIGDPFISASGVTSNLNITKIDFINGWSSSTGGSWQGTIMLKSNNVVVSELSLTLNGSGGTTQTVDNINADNITSVDANIYFTGEGVTWPSDLVLLFYNDNGPILFFGGYDYGNPHGVTQNADTWDNSWSTSTDGNYTDTIDIDTAGSGGNTGGTFALTVKAIYNIEVNGEIKPFSTITSKKLFKVEGIDDPNFGWNNSGIDVNIPTITEANEGDISNKFDVPITFYSLQEGKTYDY